MELDTIFPVLPLLVGATGIAAAVAAGYQSMAPTGQWYGRTFTGLPPGSRQIALTYDDGPNDPYTMQLLEVLARHDVHATFFMVGKFVLEKPEIARAVSKAGHVIGNHTFTHPKLIFESAENTRQELKDCDAALNDVIGEHSNLFRPPFGGRRPVTLRIVRELGMIPVMWNITAYDWSAPSPAAIEQKIARHLRGGNVILLHDGRHRAMGTDRSRTVAATDNLIRKYKNQGYEFVTITQMLSRAGA
jgi:peptidoglycan-N-acetylglucosamine deacetylase